MQNFLQTLQLERWQPIFEEIDGATLTQLDQGDLEEPPLEKWDPTAFISSSWTGSCLAFPELGGNLITHKLVLFGGDACAAFLDR